MERSSRVIQPESLADASSTEAARNLADLRLINKWFGGDRILRSLVREWFRAEDAFTVLDLGAGGCGATAWLASAFPRAHVISLDVNERNLSHGSGARVVADALAPPLRTPCADLVVCSLFLHHFSSGDAARILSTMRGLSRAGIIVTDLRRHWLPRVFLPATRWLFGWGPVTLHDGPRSVRAGFTAAELQQLAQRAGLCEARARTHPTWFRLSLTWRNPSWQTPRASLAPSPNP
ncbi:MAG: methyltransferase domain-containing protein [Candidatus Solibacter usitatus]|nr:methyltransferase domain-containing protein [Candidatus Solibacter usitatus]